VVEPLLADQREAVLGVVSDGAFAKSGGDDRILLHDFTLLAGDDRILLHDLTLLAKSGGDGGSLLHDLTLLAKSGGDDGILLHDLLTLLVKSRGVKGALASGTKVCVLDAASMGRRGATVNDGPWGTGVLHEDRRVSERAEGLDRTLRGVSPNATSCFSTPFFVYTSSHSHLLSVMTRDIMMNERLSIHMFLPVSAPNHVSV